MTGVQAVRLLQEIKSTSKLFAVGKAVWSIMPTV